MVDHDIILCKLETCGLHGIALKWFQSYLSDRQQYMHLSRSSQSHVSKFLVVSKVETQRSIRGPILFNVFMSDISLASVLIIYADDSTYLVSDPDITSLPSKAIPTLGELTEWFDIYLFIYLFLATSVNAIIMHLLVII